MGRPENFDLQPPVESGERISNSEAFEQLREILSAQDKRVSPIKAIRAKCMDCCADSADEIKFCAATTCPLWEFRFGRNPYSAAKELSDEQRDAIRERLAISRQSMLDDDEEDE